MRRGFVLKFRTMRKQPFLIATILLLLCCAAAARANCSYFLVTLEEQNHGFADAAHIMASAALEANGCEPADHEPDIALTLRIVSVDTVRRANPKGMLLAGGLSSATYLDARVTATLLATRNGADQYSETITYSSPPRELYSGWYRARSIKKHAVENAAAKLVIRFLKSTELTGSRVQAPPRANGDLLTQDRDIWPVLGGGFTGVAAHEAGHLINARLTGHDARIRRSEDRTFTAQADTVAALSVLFAHRLGDDMQFPFPDAMYDFGAVASPSGPRYIDNQGNEVPGGRSDHALIAYSGILYQNLANEYLLTRWPDLIDRDDPFKKGMFFGNILVPAVYTVRGYSDPNSDLWQLQQDLGWDRWAVNAMALAPLAADMARYYHPENKKLRRWARIAKAVPLIIVLSQ